MCFCQLSTVCIYTSFQKWKFDIVKVWKHQSGNPYLSTSPPDSLSESVTEWMYESIKVTIFTCPHLPQIPAPFLGEHTPPPDCKSGFHIHNQIPNQRFIWEKIFLRINLPMIWTSSPFGLVQAQPGRCLWFLGRTWQKKLKTERKSQFLFNICKLKFKFKI